MKLSDILSAEFGHSKEGMSAERLQASIGAAHRDTFDFAAMSRMLTAATVNVPMAESRRQRLRGLLATLRTQRFFPPATENDKWIGVAEPYSFQFETCADAVAAYRERMPKMTELAKAMAVAKLETDGEYNEARHDAFFAEFGDNGLDADDIAAFPDYLICLRAADFRAAEQDLILRAFVGGMPAKLVVQTDDLLEQSPIRDDFLVAGLRSRQLASSAIGFGAAYVLQSSSATLFQMRERVLRGLAYRGPALFSVFSGANASSLPPYLAAAAAAEARAFPAFTYDPSAGADWASRFSLDANNQADLDWPSQRLDYEDADSQTGIGNRRLHADRLRGDRSALRQIFRQGAARKMDRRSRAGIRIPHARAERPYRKSAVPADGRRRQPAAKGDRQRHAGARSAPLRRGLAQPAGARRHP